jgi:hypothetical protein
VVDSRRDPFHMWGLEEALEILVRLELLLRELLELLLLVLLLHLGRLHELGLVELGLLFVVGGLALDVLRVFFSWLSFAESFRDKRLGPEVWLTSLACVLSSCLLRGFLSFFNRDLRGHSWHHRLLRETLSHHLLVLKHLLVHHLLIHHHKLLLLLLLLYGHLLWHLLRHLGHLRHLKRYKLVMRRWAHVVL